MKYASWTSAYDRVIDNTDNEVSGTHIFVKRGTAGNKVLGAIDFLRKQGFTVTFVDKVK